MKIKIYGTRILVLIIVISFIFFSCNDVYTSRKRGYFKIDIPEHKYQKFNRPDFPYTFEYPVYSEIIQDTTYFDSKPENNYWINVDFPQYNARVFLSYKIIGGSAIYKIKNEDNTYRDSSKVNHFDNMVNDAFNLTNKNNVVASSITDSLFKTPLGLTGVYFKVGGNAATARQFFVSDTTKNFLRGALYFGSTPNSDSIKPVQDFLEKDIKHLINTFEWKRVTN